MKRCRRSNDTERKRKERHRSNTVLKRKMRRRTTRKPLPVDRLTSLPDQILGHILSLLPTKDVAAMQLLSKRMRHALDLITSVDLDDSPICHCHCRYMNRTHLVEHFPLFKSFVTKVLRKLLVSEVEEPLTRFRLRFGGYLNEETCFSLRCFPYLEPTRLNAWISYPLAHSGLRELQLSFRVSNPTECKLPPKFFNFPSLECLRVDANIKIVGTDIPLICLPNLKLMHIYCVTFAGDDFITRLVSSCPVLEDLSTRGCMWDNYNRMTISSHSLRRMFLSLVKPDIYESNRTEIVTLDTPNLQYFRFVDNLPYLYSITHMNFLVEANLSVYDHYFLSVENSVRSQLSLLSSLTQIQHLTLQTGFIENMFLVAELKDRLAVFHNLRTITLCPGKIEEWRWDIVMSLILHSSPVLETIVFPEGIFCAVCQPPRPPRPDEEEAYLEAEGWRTNTLPSCWLTHLKRIEFGTCYGIDRELNMIKFFLSEALALEELVLCVFKDFYNPIGCLFPEPNFEVFIRELEELPRASNSCSIIVR